MHPDPNQRPNRIPWPPLIFLAADGAALGLGAVLPAGLPFGTAGRLAGGALALSGLALDVAAMVAMVRARTNILPHRGADRLVRHGPFRYTRNPIYLGNTLLLAGLGLALANAWFLPAAAAAAFAVDRLAVRREEAHLAARFGAAWHDYAASTPRWLGRAR